MADKAFASTGDVGEKTVSFTEIGPDLYAYTAEGDPIPGSSSATTAHGDRRPGDSAMAQEVIARVRTVTDKRPCVRGALALPRRPRARRLRLRRAGHHRVGSHLSPDRRTGRTGQGLEMGRFPRLFRGSIRSRRSHLADPHVRERHVGVRAGARSSFSMSAPATRPATSAWVPDADVIFSGDLVEYHSAVTAATPISANGPDPGGDPRVRAARPRAGPMRSSAAQVREAVAMTRDFVTTLYGAAALPCRGGRDLKQTLAAAREVMDPKFEDFAIYEHRLPFNVSRFRRGVGHRSPGDLDRGAGPGDLGRPQA